MEPQIENLRDIKKHSFPPTELRKSTEQACNVIDAAIFVGDEFLKKASRDRLIAYMTSWVSELKSYDAMYRDGTFDADGNCLEDEEE